MLNVTTFFSYKGGAGRSTTCLNTLPFIVDLCEAYNGARIMLLDMDIESAGMTYLLNQQDVFKDKKYDVKQLLKGEDTWTVSRQSDLSKHPVYKEFVPVGNILGLPDNESVMFLGVNDSTEQLNSKAVAGIVERVMGDLVKFAENNNVRAIIIDSAAGDQYSARLSVDNSDKIVFCMRPTKQFRIGTFNYLRRMAIRYGSLASDKDIILLPTVVPADAEVDGKSQLITSVEDIKARINLLPNLEIINDFLMKENFGINEIRRFKWKEGVLYKLQKENGLEEDEKTGLEKYRYLAKLITD